MKWRFLSLGIPNWPGLGVIAYRSKDGLYRPRMLSQQHGSISYAAAMVDGSGNIFSWYELWIQDPYACTLSVAAERFVSNNLVIDQSWKKFAEKIGRLDQGQHISIGCDQPGCPAIWIDQNEENIRVISDSWVLCVNDEILHKSRLAPYTSTTHRYLWNGNESNPKFVACTENAPGGPNVETLEQLWPLATPLNPAGSMMFLRPCNTMTLPTFVEILSGSTDTASWKKSLRMPESVYANQLSKSVVANHNAGLIYAKRHTPGQLAEIFHLKLSLIKSIITAVRDSASIDQCPMLLISPDSFHISIATPNSSLPFLWSHHVSLVDSPDAIRIEVGDTREPMVVPVSEAKPSIYRSPAVSQFTSGVAQARIRTITEPDDEGLVTMSGSFSTDLELALGRFDTLILEWSLPRGGRKQIVARVEPSALSSAAEHRFVSNPTKFNADVDYIMSRHKQSIQPDSIHFTVIPRLGSTCDLYSLAIVALRILLVHPDGLPATLHDLINLQQLYKKRTGNNEWQTGLGSLDDFVRSGEAGDILSRLGPQHLISDSPLSASEAFQEIPSSLWWTTINFLLRLIPGECQNAFATNYEDFNPRAIQEVYHRPLEELEVLLEKSRNVLFGNHATNREIRNIIRHLI